MEGGRWKENQEAIPSSFQPRTSGISGSLRPLPSSFIILRHDVDLLPQNSLAFARIQHAMGIKGSYYFRAVPESWKQGPTFNNPAIQQFNNLAIKRITTSLY